MKTIKIFAGLFFTAALAISCNGQKKEKVMNTEEDKTVYVIALIYLNEGMEDTFMEYKQKVGPIVKKYGANIERVIKPLKLAQGTMELPDEIHVATFASPESMQKMNEDPEYQNLVTTLRYKAIKKMVFMPCTLSGFEFNREIGTKDKTFGLAMLNYNDGMKNKFDEYHKEACEILPEFGAHFERFFNVVDIKGDFTKPDEIHLFYFDSPEGMKKMGQDVRMQKLFPKRDQSLKNLNFIIGKAI